ncbi:MAG: ABC transporter permease [Spirochaetes bacterium GWD1_61_31]|nr:MAG: ABC transporter permease [Spirochaetes bacterium GWB1_60_80]OHD38681.1 MAG: ABC transporter permease [Spirochaetes bacterium GWD1_61_31]OHD43210.1 MAG: ABC transporter permease [Spirochaetes bacterium GWE1_60_18]OHD58773.1 MAG: ABC transporter permease [Spirochaetes bacterium GWF1_60_12]
MNFNIVKRRRANSKFWNVLFVAAIILVVASVLFPYLWMISGSFKRTIEIQSADYTKPGQEPSLIPRQPTLENYQRINRTVPMLRYLRNSLIISIGTMILAVFISLFAAYALSRLEFRFKRLYELTIYSTQMFPGIAFLIPYFILFTAITRLTGIKLKDTYYGLILTYTSFALPFCILMMKSYLDSIPKSLDEQALVDGCKRPAIIFRIILPLVKPGLVSVGIFAFIMAWNEMLFASVLTGRDTKTVSLGLMEYITTNQARWGGMMAACIVVSIPVLILFTTLQKQIIDGLIKGAVKE